MVRWRSALCLIGTLLPAALGSETATAATDLTSPPTIDCTAGFEGLRAYVQSLAGAEWRIEGGYDIASISEPEKWRADFAFTSPSHPAHPAVTLRTFRKQVTEVWTADSKGCGYGNQAQFVILMNDMKSGDTELTNASRHDVEQRRGEQSPLGLTP